MSEAEAKLKEAKNSSSYNTQYDTTVNNALRLIDGYETEDFASIQAVANALNKLNATLFKGAVADLNEAASWLIEYEKSK